MAKSAPARVSFNAGEFSPLLDGRTDFDRYPSSMRKLFNFIVAPQGPAIRRSGTRFIAPASDDSQFSGFVNFEFNETQLYLLEFCNGKMRVLTEDGLITYAPSVVTAITAGANLKITSAALAADIGDAVALDGFPAEANVNGLVAKITAKAGNVYTLDVDYPAGVPYLTVGTAARVYSVAVPYTGEAARRVYGLQDDEAVYLFCDGYRVQKVKRYGNTDWRVEAVQFKNGPFMPVMSDNSSIVASDTGNPIPPQTSNVTANGAVFDSGRSAGQEWFLVDNSATTTWVSVEVQRGMFGYEFATPIVINGYSFGAPRGIVTSEGYTSLDHAPATWAFYGSLDGTNYIPLDAVNDHVLYDGGRTPVFTFKNTVAYKFYKWEVFSSRRGSGTKIALSGFTLIPAVPKIITLTLQDGVSYNGNGQFKNTDVGRLLRLKSRDGTWRVLEITSYIGPASVRAKATGEPLGDTFPTLDWQPGYLCDTVGWPTTAVFFEDRMYMGGMAAAPNVVVGSVTGDYENFEQRTPANEVLDESALVLPLKARKQSRIVWLETDERGLLIGTGTNEWVIASTGEGVITARQVRARSSTARGSAPVVPVKVDRQVLYVQRSKRTIREFAYVYEADGYKSPSMSLFASHIGVKQFEQLAYASEPYSIVWARRGDGTVAGLTYNREENVTGWHVHDFGGFVEAIATLPSRDGLQDALWMVIRREINGVQRRYIEVVQRFWDFESVIEEAHFVNSGLTYDGTPQTMLYGAKHLEGQAVVGLHDGVPFEGVVVNGAIKLPNPASKVVFGLPYTSEGQISRIEAASADGSSQGKTKRIHEIKANLWDTAMGEIAVSVGEQELEYNDIPYPDNSEELLPIELFTGITKRIGQAPGYDVDCTVSFRQTAPRPFNLIALLPIMHTQDG